jgi:hypothetical protein
MNGLMMKMKRTKATPRAAVWIFQIAFFSYFCFQGGGAIAEDKVSGRKDRIVGAWTWTSKQNEGELFTSVMDISFEETGSFTGGIRNPEGERIPFESVNMKGDQIQVVVDHEIMGQAFKASYGGKVTGSNIEGEVVIRFQDRILRRDWKVRRLLEFPLTGEWDWKLSTPDGNELKATLIIHQDAEGVSGRLESEQFNMPLRDISFKAGQLKFVTQREENGGTFYSSGKWHGNLLSGQVSSPSIGEGLKLPWEARKR